MISNFQHSYFLSKGDSGFINSKKNDFLILPMSQIILFFNKSKQVCSKTYIPEYSP